MVLMRAKCVHVYLLAGDMYSLPAYLLLQMATLLNSYSIRLLSKRLANFSEIAIT
jgi:hypothetical protein